MATDESNSTGSQMNPPRLKGHQDWNDDSDANWTIDSEGRSSLSGRNVRALVASDGQASLRRSNSETDLLVSEEEVNQTFACWKEDLVGITGLYGPVVDKLPLANVSDHGWDTEQYLSEGLIAGFEECKRKTSESCQKMFARARVCRERVLGGALGPCGYRLHSARIAERLRVQALCGCSERYRFCVYRREMPHEPVSCAQMMKLCKALEELHVELKDLPFDQYRARNELPLMQQWARDGADDRVTLPDTTATSQPTLSAAEPRRLRNDFEDFYDIKRPQLIRSAEIALPLLTSWNLLVVDKPAGARPRCYKRTCHVRRLVLHRPRIWSFWRPWIGRYAPIGHNKRTARGEQRTLMRKRYLSALARHTPHVLKATQSCFRLKLQMCPCVGDAS